MLKSFTLIEILIVVSLFVILAVMFVPLGIDFYHSRILEEETIALSSILERARSFALAGKENSDWGVKLDKENAQYIIFKGSNCDTGESYQTFNLPSNVEIDEESIDCVIFERHTGNPQIFQ